MFIISYLLLFAATVGIAQELPGTSWSLNPQYKFQEKVGAIKFSGEHGFNISYTGDGLELQLKGTKMVDPVVARQMGKVEFGNLEKLYSARGNPYEGQITEIIECDKTYKPRFFTVKQGGQELKALLVGASERRLFGACVKEQVAYWVSYYNFYDPDSKLVIESRLFLKTKNPDARAVGELSKKLEKLTQNLLVPKRKT